MKFPSSPPSSCLLNFKEEDEWGRRESFVLKRRRHIYKRLKGGEEEDP